MAFPWQTVCQGALKARMNSAYHIYSRYRAIPAIDIGIRDISIGTLTSGPAASRAARHACTHAMQSLESISQRTASTAWISDIAIRRRPILYVSLVLHRISLFNSARLLTLSSWISRCVRRQHVCGSHSSSASRYFEVKYQYR